MFNPHLFNGTFPIFSINFKKKTYIDLKWILWFFSSIFIQFTNWIRKKPHKGSRVNLHVLIRRLYFKKKKNPNTMLEREKNYQNSKRCNNFFFKPIAILGRSTISKICWHHAELQLLSSITAHPDTISLPRNLFR